MMRLIEVACWCHIENNKLLLLKSKKNPETFYMPGGKIEKGEDKKQALIRELHAELNIRLLPNTIHYYNSFGAKAFNETEGVEVIDHCFWADFAGKFLPSGEIECYSFFSFDTFPLWVGMHFSSSHIYCFFLQSPAKLCP
ncbi:MAG: NUDIX domain-containing protein [Chitinophagaceae bacterium]|nr:NUDIX domain-containing protein [Chitinophagaceae bacterium]